jgi:hypothetical protein
MWFMSFLWLHAGNHDFVYWAAIWGTFSRLPTASVAECYQLASLAVLWPDIGQDMARYRTGRPTPRGVRAAALDQGFRGSWAWWSSAEVTDNF